MHKSKFIKYFILLLSLLLPLNSFPVYAVRGSQNNGISKKSVAKTSKCVNTKKIEIDKKEVAKELQLLGECIQSKGGNLQEGAKLYLSKSKSKSEYAMFTLGIYNNLLKSINGIENDDDVEIENDDNNDMYVEKKKINLFIVGPSGSGKTWLLKTLLSKQVTANNSDNNEGETRDTEYGELYFRYINGKIEPTNNKKGDLVVRLFSTSGLETSEFIEAISNHYAETQGSEAANIIIFTASCYDYIKDSCDASSNEIVNGGNRNKGTLIQGTYEPDHRKEKEYCCGQDIYKVFSKFFNPWYKRNNKIRYVFLGTQMDRFAENKLKLSGSSISCNDLRNNFMEFFEDVIRRNYPGDSGDNVGYFYIDDRTGEYSEDGVAFILDQIERYINGLEDGYNELEDYDVDDWRDNNMGDFSTFDSEPKTQSSESNGGSCTIC